MLRIRCPDFPHLRPFCPIGMPMLNAELVAKCAFSIWFGCWGFEVVME